jgi:O-antigen/teichoic acid export membrane protein
MAAGAAWMVLFKLSERVLSLISMLVLARLLVPADFGVVAIASSVLALLEVFIALGLDVALISRPDVTREHYNSAWTFKVLLGLAVALILLIISGPAALFFNEPRIADVIRVLAIGSFVQGLENIGVVDFRKELKFATEFRFQIAKRLIMIAVTLPLAFLLRNYWALTIGAVTGRVAWVVLSYFAHPFRPRWSLSKTRDLMSLSTWLVFSSALYYFAEQSANLALGRLSGPRATGLYALSYDFASLPTAQLIAPINRAVLPGLAKLSGKIDELARSALNVFALTCMLAIPAGMGLSVTAPVVVPLLLGKQWLEAVPVLQLLALASATNSLLSSSWATYLALQSPRTPTLIHGVYVLLQGVLLILLCPKLGAHGAAISVFIAAIVIVPINYLLLLPRLHLRARTFPALIVRPILAALTMYVLLRPWMAAPGTASTIEMLGTLALALIAGPLIYMVALLLLWRLWQRPAGAESLVLEWVEPRLPGALRSLVQRLLLKTTSQPG